MWGTLPRGALDLTQTIFLGTQSLRLEVWSEAHLEVRGIDPFALCVVHRVGLCSCNVAGSSLLPLFSLLFRSSSLSLFPAGSYFLTLFKGRIYHSPPAIGFLSFWCFSGFSAFGLFASFSVRLFCYYGFL